MMLRSKANNVCNQSASFFSHDYLKNLERNEKYFSHLQTDILYIINIFFENKGIHISCVNQLKYCVYD